MNERTKETLQIHDQKDRSSHLHQNPFESNTLGKLFEALAKAQLEMEVAKTDNVNPFFKSKYCDLAGIVRASRPYLAKSGLCVIQRVVCDDLGKTYLCTRLGHISGEWMESKMAILPPKQDIQTIGSYITYLRRYTYAAMVGVVASGEDDDGEKAMDTHRSPVKESHTITMTQLHTLSKELDGMEETLDSILDGYKISKLADLPHKAFDKVLVRIKDLKQAHEKNM